MYLPDTPDPAVVELLLEWEERRAGSGPLTPEELCPGQPATAASIRRGLTALARVDRTLAAGGAPPAAPIPSPIPGFEILGVVGRGGMGEVYQARDLALDREVAIKVPRVDFARGPARSCFEREARLLARLRHPNIVPVYAAGLVGDRPYFVMDFVPGGSVADRVPLPMPAGEAVLLVEQVARAVDHAHRCGIVHRDLKPSNILLDGAGAPLVGDFGVAAFVPGFCPLGGRPGATDAGVDHAGGTPAYAAPEAAHGASGVGPGADVWSLGVILHQLLTGTLPAAGAGATAGRPGFPSGLERIIRRCLVREPAGRYQSAGALAGALAGWRRRAKLRLRLRRLIWCAAGVAVGLLVTTSAHGPDPPARRHAAAGHALTDALRLGPVNLVPAGGRPATYLVRGGHEYTRAWQTDDGLFRVDAPRPALVELLPAVPVGRYRLTAEVREEGCLNEAEVGLYVCYRSVPVGGRESHLGVSLTFGDLGPASVSFPGPDGRAGGAAGLRGYHLTPPDPLAGPWDRQRGPWVWYPPPPVGVGQAGPWRRLRVEVTPAGVRAGFDGLAIREFAARTLDGFARRQLSKVGHPGAEAARVDPGGGLGLYVDGCTASFANVVIEPILDP